MRVLGVVAGHDDIEGNYAETRRLIATRPDLIGIYNVGGGNEGAVRALKDAGVDQEILYFGHNLTPKTHAYLMDGSMDVVIHQNMRRAAQDAVDMLIGYLKGRPYQAELMPVEIVTRENTHGISYG